MRSRENGRQDLFFCINVDSKCRRGWAPRPGFSCLPSFPYHRQCLFFSALPWVTVQYRQFLGIMGSMPPLDLKPGFPGASPLTFLSLSLHIFKMGLMVMFVGTLILVYAVHI